MARIKKTKSRFSFPSVFSNYWTKENYIILGFGIFLVFLGYYFMSFGPWDNPMSLTISPIVLLIAYIVVFPLSILYKKKKKTED